MEPTAQLRSSSLQVLHEVIYCLLQQFRQHTSKKHHGHSPQTCQSTAGQGKKSSECCLPDTQVSRSMVVTQAPPGTAWPGTGSKVTRINAASCHKPLRRGTQSSKTALCTRLPAERARSRRYVAELQQGCTLHPLPSRSEGPSIRVKPRRCCRGPKAPTAVSDAAAQLLRVASCVLPKHHR